MSFMVQTLTDKLERVDCKYGAPMGRTSFDETHGEPTRCRLSYIRFVDGCYDYGGAYWGAPADLYWLRDNDNKIKAFFRAPNREHARQQAMKEYPNITVRA